MDFVINHRRSNPYKHNPSDLIANVDHLPYLTWVPEYLRAQTIDPSTLPDRKGPRKRIMMMSSSYLTGGAEMFAVNAARLLAPYHDVYLWSLRPGDYVITGDLPVYFGDPVQLAKDLGIDVVIHNNGAAFWYQDRFKVELPHVKVIMCLHGLVQWTVDQFQGHDGQVRSVDAIWAFSRVCGAMKSFGFNAPAYELHCPVDITKYPFTQRHWARPYQIGYVGRISPEKNLTGLLRLWGKLHTALDGKVQFHFVGGLDPTNHDPQYLQWLVPIDKAMRNTPEWQYLSSIRALTDHGQSSQDHVRNVISKLHLLTLASDFEGEPVVFLEAMASGCLCSYRDVGEVGQLLTGTGLLTQAVTRKMSDAEYDQMVNSIVETLKYHARCRKMAAFAHQRILNRHANQSWTTNFNRMLEDICK